VIYAEVNGRDVDCNTGDVDDDDSENGLDVEIGSKML
jgi:hypothetical protein